MNEISSKKTNRTLDTTSRKMLLMFSIMVVFTIVMMIVRPNKFLTVNNILNILKDSAVMGTLAMGMTFVLITGGIDLSAGYNVTLGMVVAGVVFMMTGNSWIAIAACLGVTILIGFINGLVVTKMKITPFIATLATMSVAQGLIQFFGAGKTLKLSSPVFSAIGKSKILGIPTPAVIMLIVMIIGTVILKNTKLGTYTYAIGCNEKHAKSAGISIHKYLIAVYVIEGICAGIAALLLGCKVSLVSLNAGGSGTLMDTIAAVVIGGTRTDGGEGRMEGTILGVIFMGFIINALTLLNVPSVAQDLFKGIVIILAIMFNSLSIQFPIKKKTATRN